MDHSRGLRRQWNLAKVLNVARPRKRNVGTNVRVTQIDRCAVARQCHTLTPSGRVSLCVRCRVRSNPADGTGLYKPCEK